MKLKTRLAIAFVTFSVLPIMFVGLMLSVGRLFMVYRMDEFLSLIHIWKDNRGGAGASGNGHEWLSGCYDGTDRGPGKAALRIHHGIVCHIWN